MLAKVNSCAIVGLEGTICEVAFGVSTAVVGRHRSGWSGCPTRR